MGYEDRAKVFISCGQDPKRGELEVGHKIEETIRGLGFETYFAIDEQSPRGLRENIFHELSTSEYFLFIDFKREKLEGTKVNRGSLFTNQELAIASYLDIPLIAFQEEGVNPKDGILGALQANCIVFTDRSSLHTIIAKKVEHDWRTNWKNALRLERNPTEYVDIGRAPTGIMARFFHINVKNCNPYKIANNCYVYLESAKNKTGLNIVTRTIEFKWEAYILPNAPILPNSSRTFDAFFVYHVDPTVLRFNLFTDSPLFIPNIRGPGDFELSYAVISDNFPLAKKTFNLHLGNDLDGINFV